MKLTCKCQSLSTGTCRDIPVECQDVVGPGTNIQVDSNLSHLNW